MIIQGGRTHDTLAFLGYRRILIRRSMLTCSRVGDLGEDGFEEFDGGFLDGEGFGVEG